MKKIIGLCGFKGTWKDFVADLMQEWRELTYKNISISNSVKILAAKEKGFLDKDDEIIKKSKEDSANMRKLRSIQEFNSFKPLTKDLPDYVILQKINIYKNYDELTTRKSLYDYFDEEKANGYEHVSLDMVSSIRACENDWVIITDTRTLLEAIDILLENGFLLNVYNSRSNHLEDITFLHFSEYELSKKIEWKRIGFAFDITSRDKKYLKKSLEEILYLFYKDFKGYSETFINELKELRAYLIKMIPDVEKASNQTYKSKDLEGHQKTLRILDDFRYRLQTSIDKEYKKIIRF